MDVNLFGTIHGDIDLTINEGLERGSVNLTIKQNHDRITLFLTQAQAELIFGTLNNHFAKLTEQAPLV
jgi:hypothetical protein